MLTSLAYVLLLGMALGALASRLRLPSLVGMLLAGILLGPCVLNLLSPSLLGISADLRQLALVIIPHPGGPVPGAGGICAGPGGPPCCCASCPLPLRCWAWCCWLPRLLGVDVLDAAIMGAVVGAVSPRSSFPGCSG